MGRKTRSLEERRSRNREARVLEGSFSVLTPRITPGVVFEGKVTKSPQNEEVTSGLRDDGNKEREPCSRLLV